MWAKGSRCREKKRAGKKPNEEHFFKDVRDTVCLSESKGPPISDHPCTEARFADHGNKVDVGFSDKGGMVHPRRT